MSNYKKNWINAVMAQLSNKVVSLLNETSFEVYAKHGDVGLMFSEKRIKRIEDRFWEKIIAYVEKNSHLLFSDYTGNTSQMERAIMYVEEIFCTRTEVANTKGEMPTNVHELVACAFHESQNTQWKYCTIQRHIDASEQWNDDFFKPFARKLKEQSGKLADNLSTRGTVRIPS